MTILQLLGLIVSQLALIAKDPALGYRGEALTGVLALLGTIIEKGDAARAELEALAAHVKEMVDAGREPTKEEWQALRDKARANHEALNPPAPKTDGE